MNLFILSNTDIHAIGTLDPLVDYDYSLKILNFKFYTTLPKGTYWTNANSRFGKTQTGVKVPKEALVKPVRLGIDWNFNATGHLVPFGSALGALEDPVAKGKPFSIVTSNCAHSLSAILSRASFEKHGDRNKKIKLVINFDYHYDFGSFNSSQVTKSEVDNGAWGAHHCGGLTNWTRIDGAKLVYAVFGVHNNGSRVMYKTYFALNEKEKKSFSKGVDGVVEGNMKDAVDGPCDVYITIDRDVLKYGCTHFTVDGSYDVSGIVKKLGNLLAGLKTKGMNICGFDVTGLPCISRGGKGNKAFLSAVNDINSLYKFIKPYF